MRTGFWAGILFEQVRHSIVVNVTLENNHYGFVLNAGFTAMQGGNRSRFNTITGNTLDANFGHGITINGGDDNLFSGNAILATKKGVGLFLYAAARNVVISNRVAGNDVGIMVDTPDSSSRENTIVDNDVSGSRRHDLVDRWNDCSHNTWSTNRSGTNATACIK